MSLYASYVCLCILASSRIPQLILRRQTSTFQGGYVTITTFEHSEQASPISEGITGIRMNIHLTREIT
jgi:hypothetical protein